MNSFILPLINISSIPAKDPPYRFQSLYVCPSGSIFPTFTHVTLGDTKLGEEYEVEADKKRGGYINQEVGERRVMGHCTGVVQRRLCGAEDKHEKWFGFGERGFSHCDPRRASHLICCLGSAKNPEIRKTPRLDSKDRLLPPIRGTEGRWCMK